MAQLISRFSQNYTCIRVYAYDSAGQWHILSVGSAKTIHQILYTLDVRILGTEARLFMVMKRNCTISATLDTSCFFSELMDLFVAGRDQSAADQPNYLAEGHPPL